LEIGSRKFDGQIEFLEPSLKIVGELSAKRCQNGSRAAFNAVLGESMLKPTVNGVITFARQSYLHNSFVPAGRENPADRQVKL
jgi:hypothetical protein